MSGQPFIKFYPGDWQSDECVSLLSLAARGLWMEMLLIMHKGGGYLSINGQGLRGGLTPPLLARMIRADLSEVERLLEELESAGVFSRNEHGVIYSRRILRDIAKAEEAREYGKRGEIGDLPMGDNPPDKPPVKRRVKSGLREGDNTHGARQSQIPEQKERERTGTKVVPLARAHARETTSPPQGFESLFKQAEEIAAGDRAWLGTMTTGLIACDADFKRGKAYLDAVSRNPRLPSRNSGESKNRFVTFGQQLIREEEDRLNGTRTALLAPRRA